MIAVVVPTIREESYKEFLKAWEPLFAKHNVLVVKIADGEDPTITIDVDNLNQDLNLKGPWYAVSLDWDSLRGKLSNEHDNVRELIFNKNDGVRNYGFWFISRLKDVEYIITLDDDVKPIGDPIQDHIDALNMKVPVSWMNTADKYMRGVPYKVREEAEVVLSHGVWQGVKDWDAPTQLVLGNRDTTFYKGVIPKGVYYPMCGMNIAFKKKMLPYMYYAPMGYKVGMDRFADIWLGITSKRVIDENGWAVVTGYAEVLHERASNVWKNLQKEAKGLELNETFWEGDESDPYFKLYEQKRKEWEKVIKNEHNL